jgi:hypothetical protein
MKRHVPGLNQHAHNQAEVPEGLYLTRVERASYRAHPAKPFFNLRFVILEPEEMSGKSLSGRLYCTSRALWKLSWFLRDFGYDAELLNRDEVDEKTVVGLRGVLKVSQATFNGRCYLNLDGFAPEGQWEELSATIDAPTPEHSYDL